MPVSVRGPLIAVTLFAFLVRVLRLEWQPLWWDEGYSVFFATEPVKLMLALTAQDIHPPLYYALLHVWTLLLDSARPGVDRLLSVYAGALAVPLLGVFAYALTRRASVAVLASSLLALNPLHVYYSQEIRMYSLAMLLGLAATYALHKLAAALEAEEPAGARIAIYVLLSTLLLYTLYYAAFLVAAQFIWLAWHLRMRRRTWRSLVLAATLITLLCLPWWLYALPKLAGYVGDKVQSDQDASLGPLTYLLRHLLAFTSGHVQFDGALPRVLAYVGLLAAIPIALTTRRPAITNLAPVPKSQYALGLLWAIVSIPFLLAFLLNLRFPFFPDDGERLLLFILPYFLLLAAIGASTAHTGSPVWLALVSPLLLTSSLGLAGYYSVPRYAEDDYRPIITQVMRQGSDAGAVLALFPWQVGYWRAYSPQDESGRLLLPQPDPVGQSALIWNQRLQARIDAALTHGILWFPAPVSLGSTLPGQIEAYLQDVALNVENRWHGPATRLTTWTARPPDMTMTPVEADFGPLTLDAAAVSSSSITSDNSVIAVALQWSLDSYPEDWHVALRLRDSKGRDWSGRDYQPPGRFDAQAPDGAHIVTDTLGLLAPVGLPPGDYTLLASVAEAAGSSPQALEAAMVPLAQISVHNPDTPVSRYRLPIDYVARGPRQEAGVSILGATELAADQVQLAGADLTFALALEKTSPQPIDYSLSVILLDGSGNGVASWEGWPLPDYPTSAWPDRALTLVPLSVHLPAGLPAGQYALTVGQVESSTAARPPLQRLAAITVRSRPAVYERPQPDVLLPAPFQFGTHALLYGYDLEADGNLIQLALYWEVLQTLLPPHHIFVHVAASSEDIVAQEDGPPVSVNGPAPTGSWRAGEFITSQHAIRLPSAASGEAPYVDGSLRVGLYEPDSEVRLPAFVNGLPVGDSAEIAIAP